VRRLYHHLSLAWGFLVWLAPILVVVAVAYCLVRLLRSYWGAFS
jgi:hypothetical protein